MSAMQGLRVRDAEPLQTCADCPGSWAGHAEGCPAWASVIAMAEADKTWHEITDDLERVRPASWGEIAWAKSFGGWPAESNSGHTRVMRDGTGIAYEYLPHEPQ